MEEKNVILVTWDFTEKSVFALEHAEQAARVMHSQIIALHIAKKDSEIPILQKKLQAELSKFAAKSDKEPEALVRTGTIFETIGQTAEDIGARMVFMGTHGIKGSQKFFGSWALKVITHTKVPFIVVQAPPTGDTLYKNIVFPLNYRKENKECVNWMTFFSRHFNSRINVLVAKHTDTNFIKGVESNILFLTKNFKSKNVDFVMEDAPGETDFVKEVVDYAQKIKADSIFVVTTRDIGFTDYLMGAHEQFLIANHGAMPVICINPKPPKFGGSFSTSGS
jgi:nucleotide-binding universal stress UspA family protein